MATLRELRTRIKSVNSTKQITKAQELIATSKITKAQAKVTEAQPYAQEITTVVSQLANAGSLDHPMLKERENPQRVAVLVISSDRGMCGGYNTNVFKKAIELRNLLEEEGKEPVLYVSGSKGLSYYKFRDEPVEGSIEGHSQEPEFSLTKGLNDHLIQGFLAGSDENIPRFEGSEEQSTDSAGDTIHGFDELHVVYTEFVSMLHQNARVERVLPIETVVESATSDSNSAEAQSQSSTEELSGSYSFEPDADTLMESLLPQYVSRTIFELMLESAASESASRRTAMSSATDNASELVKNLSRVANQARQAQITQEITEIVGGAAAAVDENGESD